MSERRPAAVPDWLRFGAAYGWRLLVVTAIAALLWLVFRQLKLIVVGLVLGYLESVALWPLVRWLRARRVPQAFAALIAVLAAVALLIGFFVLLLRVFVGEAADLASHAAAGGDEIRRWLTTTGTLEPAAAERIFASITDLLKQLGSFLGSGIIGAIAFLGQLVTILFLAQFLAIYFLADWQTLWGWFLALHDPRRRDAWDRAGRAATETVGAWLRAQTAIALFDAVLIGVGVALLEVPLALAIGFLTFLLAYIPLIGALLSGAVAVLVALGARGAPTALAVLVIVLVVQQLEANVLGPLLTARAVRFHAVATFLMMTAAGVLFGVIGMFLVVPAAGAFVAMSRELRSGPDPPEDDGRGGLRIGAATSSRPGEDSTLDTQHHRRARSRDRA